MTFELESLTEADEAFRWGVFVATIKPLVEEATGLDEARLRAALAEQLPAGTHKAIVKGGVRVGVLQVEDTVAAISLSQIEILPEFQGLGLGGAILDSLVARSERERRPLVLRVFRANPRARALYERHGFRVVKEEEHDLMMTREPDAQGSHLFRSNTCDQDPGERWPTER